MQITIAGRAYPPASSEERPAELRIDGDHAVLRTEGGIEREAGTRSLRIEPPLGRVARRIILPDGDLFWTEDTGAIAALERDLKIRRLSGWEAFHPRLILVVALALVGAWAIWRFALPALIWVAAAMTPQPLREAIDGGTVQAFDRFIAEESGLTENRKNEVQAIFDDLLFHSDQDPKDFTLLFRDMPGLGPNAMALPGGTVIITDALVLDFPDASVVAGVLGHEIGHVDHDHGLKQVYRSLGIYVLITLIAGDTGPVLDELLLEGGLMMSLTYSRAFEREADFYGLNLAEAAGYDPEGLLEFFRALPDAEEMVAGWSSTHPASGERIEAIRSWLADR